MKLLVVLSCILVAALAADKLLGHRTATNYPVAWRKGSAASPSHQMTFLIALKQRNLDVLEDAFWAVSDPQSPEYRNFMTIEEIDSIVNPLPQVYEEVYAWLRSNGVSDITKMNAAIKVRASVEIVEQLFNTECVEFEHVETGRKIVRQFGQFSVPEVVAEHIVLVSGLSEFPMPRFTIKKSNSFKRANAQNTPAIVPQSVEGYYGTGNAAVSHPNSSACAIEFEDQYYAPSDLANFAQSVQIAITPLTNNHIIGQNDPTQPQLEATLDIEYILSVAQKAVGWFWIEDDTVWLYGFSTHLYGTAVAPYVNSISYGWNEQMQCEDGIGSNECQQLGVNSDQYVALVNTNFQKIGLRGITLICASGDSGANGRTDPYCTENHLNPVFPAASPYITSCGATQIDQNNPGNPVPNAPPACQGETCTGSGGYEECVSYSQANFASGGGFSNVASVPSYQRAATSAYLASGVTLPPAGYYNVNGRGFPDIAAFGSNVLISSGGSIEGVGGTSCASPIFAGIITLLNDYALNTDGKPLGFLNPLLYQMQSSMPSTFHDITTGDNICTEDGCSPGCKGFLAAKGWDPVSGLGSPQYPAMLQYVQKLLKK